MNYAYVAFRSEQTDKMLAYMEQNRKDLDRLKDSETYGELVAVLHIFKLLGDAG